MARFDSAQNQRLRSREDAAAKTLPSMSPQLAERARPAREVLDAAKGVVSFL